MEATLEIAALAAEVNVVLLPEEGLQGAKSKVVGRLSTNVQESATTAVATPLVVVCKLIAVSAELVPDENDCT